MAQRKHLDDFLRGRIIGRLERGRTRYHQENTIERHRYGGAGWLVWGGIILGSRTDLHVQSVTITGHINRDVIPEQHVRLFRGAMGAEFLFIDHNARPHRANIVDECLLSEDIPRMNRSAYSLDLNPIEHVWDMLGRRNAVHQPPPTYLPELRRALLDEWCNIPQDQIDNLILSMPRKHPHYSRLIICKTYSMASYYNAIMVDSSRCAACAQQSTFRSIFAVTLPLVRSNSWDAQLTIPNDTKCAQLEAMSPHTITPAIEAVCHCKANAGLRHSPRGLHLRTSLSLMQRLNLDSSLKTTWFRSAAV
ncbi:transposable element Tcb2 transposase [Trichonephila clavipes]|nr:transposable element Tcb2 transposase [Trichonephila clavipes]